MKYGVNVTGGQPAHGPYDSFDQAEDRVRELDTDQFPVTICEVRDDAPVTCTDRVVSKYRFPPP